MLTNRTFKILSIFAIFFFALSFSSLYAQSSDGSLGLSDIASSSPGISDSGWSGSELTSKADEMPSFKGFGSLDQSSFIGRAASNSSFIGRGNTSSPSSSLTSSSRRTSSGGTTSTRTASRSTSSRTASRSGSTTNRNRTTGMGTRTGTGTNSNNISSLMLLSSELKTSEPAQISTNRIRATRIENGINDYGKIKTLLPITVEVDENSNALIRGAVQTQNDRRLIENYVKLYGVKTVNNEVICSENGQSL